jgi:pentatricopeptide repeat protein
MPARIRHSPLGAGLSLADLNILPFLAPRLLQAWPRSRRGQRAQSTASVRLENPATGPLNIHGQPSSGSAAARQAPPSGDRTRHPQSQYGPSYERVDGRRGPTITRTSTKPPALSPVDSTRFYPRNHTGDGASSNPDRSTLTDLHQETTDETLLRQDESSNLTREDVTGSYFSETHLDMLSDFLKSNRKDKDIQESRQYLGRHWEVFFDERRNENQSKHGARGSKRSRQMESIANFDPSVDIYDLQLEWKSIPRKYRRNYWPGLMLDILCKRPDDALKFLVATTLAEPLPNRACIEDSLDYIVEYHLYRQSRSPITSKNFAVLFEAINGLLTKFIPSKVRISSYAIYHICKHADRLQAETLLETLSRRGQEMNPNLRLHFVDFLARRGATDSAVTLLGSMHRDKVVDFTEPRVASICATLLRCSQQNPEAVHSESHIYSLLLEWGIRPSIIFYTILAHNAFESWDHETAWKIYDMIIENDIEPSDHTYSIFLHNAKLRKDQEALENILNGVKANNIRNEYVATDLLHAMLLLHENQALNLRGDEARASSESLFQRMVLLYSTYFELSPLEDLAPEYFTLDKKLSSEAEGRRMHPDCATLSLMVSTVIRCRIEQSDLPLFYNRFKSLVDAGHPDFVNVATEVNVFNAFIKALGKDRDTLPFSTQILGDMLGAEASGVKPQSTDTESNDHKRMVSPTVQTWSILVHAFMTQGQPRAAEKLVAMMRRRGVDPNKVTWNTLITGYLQMQNMAGAMHSYDRAKEEGWTIDESICDQLGLSKHQIMLDQQSETMPRTAESERPRGESEEQPDTQSSISSPDGVRSLRRAEFQTGEMVDFLLGAELKRVEIVTRIERLLRGAEGNPDLAGKRALRLKKASSGLKRLENLVDGRLYELEEESGV